MEKSEVIQNAKDLIHNIPQGDYCLKNITINAELLRDICKLAIGNNSQSPVAEPIEFLAKEIRTRNIENNDRFLALGEKIARLQELNHNLEDRLAQVERALADLNLRAA